MKLIYDCSCSSQKCSGYHLIKEAETAEATQLKLLDGEKKVLDLQYVLYFFFAADRVKILRHGTINLGVGHGSYFFHFSVPESY